MRFFEAGGQQNGMQKAVGYCNNLIIQCFLPRCLLITDQQHYFLGRIQAVSIAIRPAGFGRSGRTGWHDDRARSGRQDLAIEDVCLDQAGALQVRSGSIMPMGKPDPDTPPPLPPFDRVESHLLELLGLATRPFLLRMQESSAFLMVLCACRTVVHASSVWRAAMDSKNSLTNWFFRCKI